MRALDPVGGVRRSLDFCPAPTVHRVDIERGRAGYGFTVVGQAPCVLSGIAKGSPAHDAGLKPGDCVVSVNGTDVSAASHETVVELIGSSLRSLSLLVSSGDRSSGNVASSSMAFHGKLNEIWSNPGQVKSFEKDRGESVGSFNTILEIPGQACTSASKKQPKQRPRSEPDMSYWSYQGLSKRNPHVPDGEEPSRVVSKDSVFSDFQSQHDILPDSSVLNVGMMVGYINSMELDLVMSHSEEETLQAIRECIAQIATEQKTHYLVMMRVKCNCVQLCDDRDLVLAEYPAENLVLCAVCTQDGRFFGLVSKQVTKTDPKKVEQSACMKTLCHIFIIDPELCDHHEHNSISDHFGFSCTADPDTQGCLEFPQTPYAMLNFVSVLYTDMGDHIEKLRLKLDNEDCDAHRTQNSGSGDSGIENASPEDRESFADQWNLSSPNSSHTAWDKPSPCMSRQSNGPSLRSERRCLLTEPFPDPVKPQTNPSIGEEVLVSVPINPVSQFKEPQLPENKTKRRGSQRWPSVSIRARWQKPRPTSVDSLADSDTSGPKSKTNTLPPAMDQIPPLRYKTPGDLAYDLTLKLFSGGSKNKDAENKGYRFWGLTRGRSSVRQTSARTNRLSLARSLDDLETVASDGERGGMERHGFGSINSLESNSSLPSVTTHHALSDRRVAAWAVSFERLLQDPVGVRYFSEFLKKEFSEENILFWQACEYFSQVPEHDKKQLSQKAREIYNSFLSSKATTPVNIDSQAQLADDVLTAPRPDMFKQPQLQIFNLMKFDSYARFLKSSLYQECILAEVEGRPLPDPYHVPCSPAPSKHSFISERSTFSTPKKDTRKPRTGRSSDDLRDDPDRRNGIFSWYRNRSFGKGPKKREITDFNYNSNGRRESQGSLSSGASQEFNTPCSTLRNEKSSTWERDKTGASKSCTVALPDGSSCCVCLKQGASIRHVLLELCQKQSINMAAVDLFLVGGEKPLVLDQDSMTLSSRDLRIEKRTLFRLDLVPINRSVGLKAKPTKPVAEVLRPVVAKYGLRLNDLVARISGEIEPLDLGLPISNLDGLRVVLERSEPSASTDKSKTLPSKTPGPSLTSRGQTTQGDHRLSEKPVKREEGDKPSISETPQKKKGNRIHLDDAEEFFELLSRAQSSRADDQRGLLRKEDLVLPDFLRLKPEPSAPPSCSTPTCQKHVHDSSQLKSFTSNGHNPTTRIKANPLSPPLSPILCPQAPLGQDGEGLCDLTLVGEGDISSPNSTLLPLVPTCPPPHDANITPPPPPPSAHRNPSSGAEVKSENLESHELRETAAQKESASLNQRIDADVSPQDGSFEGYAAELRQCQSKMRNGTYSSIHPSCSLNNVSHSGQNNTTQYKATFV